MRKASMLFFLLFLVSSIGINILPPSASQSAKWTFMVYMAADNNLESVGVDDFLEMSEVGSTAEVNVVVQFDRHASGTPPYYDSRYGDWNTTKRFYVTQGMTPSPENALMDLGEVNMADPASLLDFINWSITNYPADHYFLDLWDHGMGWRGVLRDGNDYLATKELGTVLAEVTEKHGKMDIIGIDACRMTVEIVYELMDYTDFFVGSEKDEPLEGWPYDEFLRILVNNPGMGAAAVGKELVDVYVENYEENSLYSVTLSLIRSDMLDELVQAVGDFVYELNRTVPYYGDEVKAAKEATERYEEGVEYDLYHFAENLYERVDSRRIREMSLDLMVAVKRAVAYERHWDHPSPTNGVHAANAHGLSLWFPVTVSFPSYRELAFARDTQWDIFLERYLEGEKPTTGLEVAVGPEDTDGNGAADTVELGITSEISGTVVLEVYKRDRMWSCQEFSIQGHLKKEITIPLEDDGLFDLYLYLFNSTGLLHNYTTVGNLLRLSFIVSGTITDLRGEPLEDVSVSVTNTRTGDSLHKSTDAQGIYRFELEPGWFEDGDYLMIVAELGEERSETGFNASLEERAKVVNFVLQPATPPSGLTLPGIVLLVIVAMESAAIAVLILFFMRLRRTSGL